MKKTTKILVSFIILIITGFSVFLYSTQISPKNLTLRHESITSSSIPDQMDGFKILFFSDLHYNQYMDKERFEPMLKEINAQNADVVLFGGDLFDHPSSNMPTDEIQNELIELLTQIQAPYGKFAVLGNHDLESNTTKELVEEIYYKSNFEVITNQRRRLRKNSNESIVLIGLDSQSLGNPDFETPFENVLEEDYTIVLCHTPDTVLEVPQNLTDLFFAGHGHGGQIDFPIFGAYYTPTYAEEFYKGRYNLNGTLLDVTNGLGTTLYDVRFLAEPEIVVYTLNAQ